MNKLLMHRILLFAGLLSLAAFAQNTKPAPLVDKNSSAMARSSERQRALSTVIQLFDISRGLPDQTARIQIGARVADVLWDHDPLRARQYFAELLHQLDSIQSNGQDSLTAETQATLRRDLMRMIARRDPAMAERLLKSYANSRASGQADPTLYPEVAATMAAGDPQRAAALLRTAMAGGITRQFINALQAIREVDRSTADSLFYQSLAAAAANDIEAFGNNLPLLASYVFSPQSVQISQPAPDSQSDSDSSTVVGDSIVVSGVDPDLTANFLNFAFQALLLNPSQDNVAPNGQSRGALAAYVALLQLLPYYQQFQPENAVAILDGFNRLASAISDPAKRSLLTNLVLPATPQQVVQAGASLVKTNEKDLLSYRAGLQAANHGDMDLALSIASSIEDAKLKEGVESAARIQAATRALARQDLDTAYTLTLAVPSLQQQAAMLNQIVRLLLKNKNIVRAGQMVDAAERVMQNAHDTPDKVRGLLVLSDLAAQFDETRAMTILQLAVNAINRSQSTDKSHSLPAPAAKPSEAASAIPSFNFQKSFGLLARTHFYDALALAQSVHSQELSISAQLAACQGLLAAPEKKLRNKTNPPHPDANL